MTTPAQKVYYNLDLRTLILSFNRCNSCDCYGYKDNTNNHTPRFFIFFYDVFCLQQWKTIHNVCKLCLDHTQYCNDTIIFHNRKIIVSNPNSHEENKNKKYWKEIKGPNRNILL